MVLEGILVAITTVTLAMMISPVSYTKLHYYVHVVRQIHVTALHSQLIGICILSKIAMVGPATSLRTITSYLAMVTELDGEVYMAATVISSTHFYSSLSLKKLFVMHQFVVSFSL